MFEFRKFIAFLILFVYYSNEQNVGSQSISSELQLSTQKNEENMNSIQTFKGHYIEEKRSSKPCKQTQNRRFGNKDSDLFESLPLTAAIAQTNTASVGNKIVTSSIQGANYNYKENTDTETENKGSKDCDCDNCILEANKKVMAFESLALDSNSNPFNNALIDIKAEESEPADSDNAPFKTSVLDESISDDKKNIPIVSLPLNINSGDRAKPCNKGLNTPHIYNTRRKKCGRIDLSENISTTPTTRRILPGILENPDAQEIESNKLYQDSPNSNYNDELEAEARHIFFPNAHKVSNSYDIDLVHNMNINEVPIQNMPLEDPVESQLIEPTKGKGIYDMKDAGVMLLENSRVCYACSTISDPTCWTPDRRTTVKYCRKGHRSCLTKSFKHKGKSVIIRDCGSNCVNSPTSEENYNSCSICHSDLCNGAASKNIFSAGIVIITVFGIIFNTD